MTSEITLTLCEIADTEDGAVRLDTSDMHQLGVSQNDVVTAEGNRRVYLTVQPALMGDRNQRLAGVSKQTAQNIGFTSGQKISLVAERLHIPYAERITLKAADDLDQIHVLARENQIGNFWDKRTIAEGDEFLIPTLDSYSLSVKVDSMKPAGPARVGPATEFSVGTSLVDNTLLKIGGLRDSYRKCYTLAEGRLKKNLSVAAHSILLTGPSGCGKSRLVARLAQEMEVVFQTLDAYQLVDRWITHGAQDLSSYLHELAKRGKTILLLDHLESLSSADTHSSTIAAAARSVTAQLCMLLDEVATQPDVLVFGITSGHLDSRFEHNQRFDLTLQIDPPNRWGRNEILHLATEHMPLEKDVDLSKIATLSSGMTAQDLNNLARSAALSMQGDKITSHDFMTAFRALKPSAINDVQCDIPPTLWNEVAGLDDIKDLLEETLSWSLTEHEKFNKSGVQPPRSILLSGGEGTGKTSLVRALAGHMPMHFIEANCAVLLTKSLKESQKYIKDCFVLARRKAPCLIFFDDIDAFFDSASESDESTPYHHLVIAQLLVELDALSKMPGVIVIAATNRPDRLTRDILKPGRFDFALTLPMPDHSARKKILQIHARKLPLSEDIDFDNIASSIQGMSSAEIANLCNRVGLIALRKSMNKPGDGGLMPVVSSETFLKALRGRKN